MCGTVFFRPGKSTASAPPIRKGKTHKHRGFGFWEQNLKNGMWSENSPIKSAGFKLGAEFGPQGYCDVAISQQRPPCARFHNRRAQPWLPKSKGAAMGAMGLVFPVVHL